jgi:uncharacterized protein
MTAIEGSLSVVTGASSGIGEAVARALAARGSHVLLLARNARRLELVEREIRDGGGRANGYPVDLADPAAIAAVARQMALAHGAPHILVNNAGAGRWLPILETMAEEAAQMIAVPYLGAFNLARELLPGMLARGSGHIVNVTSVAARLAWPGAVAYSTARAAMEGFTHALRADLHGSGVDVTLAMFGTVDTPYWEHNPGSRERLPRQASRVPVLSAGEAASLLVSAIEKGTRTLIAPRAYRLLFLLNRLVPRTMEASLCRTS